MSALMHLKILLPFTTFAENNNVLRIVAETKYGSFGILPNRLDCAASLTAGILTYETEVDGEVFIALDEGVLVKAGHEVMVSARRAIIGRDLDTLHASVKEEFLVLDAEEKKLQTVMTKLETGFLRRFVNFKNE